VYWYGFVITAAVGALVVTRLAALIPDKVMERVPWRSLAWVAPICAIIYIAYVLLPYATKTPSSKIFVGDFWNRKFAELVI
jgi:hypothetical protein